MKHTAKDMNEASWASVRPIYIRIIVAVRTDTAVGVALRSVALEMDGAHSIVCIVSVKGALMHLCRSMVIPVDQCSSNYFCRCITLQYEKNYAPSDRTG